MDLLGIIHFRNLDTERIYPDAFLGIILSISCSIGNMGKGSRVSSFRSLENTPAYRSRNLDSYGIVSFVWGHKDCYLALSISQNRSSFANQVRLLVFIIPYNISESQSFGFTIVLVYTKAHGTESFECGER